MKRVLMVTYHYSPTFSGATLQAFSLAEELRKKGLLCDFLAANSRNNAPWRIEKKNGFTVYALKGKPIIFVSLFAIFLAFRHKKYKAIHFHGFFPGHFLCVLFAKMIADIIVVQKMTKGDATNCELPIHGSFPWLRRKPLKRIDRFIAISSDLRNALLAHGVPEGKIALIPNGVNTQLFHQAATNDQNNDKIATKPDQLILVYSGSIDKRKNVHLLIKALQSLIQLSGLTHKDVQLLVAGPVLDHGYYQEIEEYIQCHDLESQIFFLGHMEQPNLANLYANATLFVFAGTNEGLPNAVIEAKSSGLPIVAFDAYGVRDVVRNGVDGYLVLFGDTNHFAEKIRTLLLDNDLRQLMTSQAILDVQKRYSFKVVAEKYLQEIYQ